MKMANLDKIFGWRLSWEFVDKSRLAKNPLEKEKQRENVDRLITYLFPCLRKMSARKKFLYEKFYFLFCKISYFYKNISLLRQRSLFYFADVCAGPGGFSEYMLWRKGYYNSKGFGFTLTGISKLKIIF